MLLSLVVVTFACCSADALSSLTTPTRERQPAPDIFFRIDARDVDGGEFIPMVLLRTVNYIER
jgi:hypothetical protein